MRLIELVEYVDELLQVHSIPDASRNGLQVQGAEKVKKVAFAVDACLAAFQQAIAVSAQLLVVHHGLLWRDAEPLVGVNFRRVKTLVESGLALYAAHLPLDVHPQFGNNVQLIRLLEMRPGEEFGESDGIPLGRIGYFDAGIERETLLARLESALGARCALFPFGGEYVHKAAVTSGAAAFLLPAVIKAGCDAFVTGETRHSAYHPAKERALNVYMAGHYATETVGLQALRLHLESKFGLETEFLRIPTGL